MDAGSGHQANTHASPGTATYQETVGKGKCAVPQHLAVKVQLWIPLAFRDKSDHVDGCRHIGRGSERLTARDGHALGELAVSTNVVRTGASRSVRQGTRVAVQC